MGQIEVYEWLKHEARIGRHDWVTSKDVARALNVSIDEARGDLVRLSIYGYLDTKQANRIGDWCGWFRIKKKYVNREK